MAKQIRPVVWSWAIHWSVLSSTVACQANITTGVARCVRKVMAAQMRTIIWSFDTTHHFVTVVVIIVIITYALHWSVSVALLLLNWQKQEYRYWKTIFFLIFNTENAGSDPWPYPNRPTDGPEPSPTLHQHPRHYVECIVWVMETESMSESPEIIVCLKLNRTVLRKSVFSDYEHLMLHQLFVMYMCFDWRMSMISCLCTTR